MSLEPDLVIIGGGITGLVSAYLAARAQRKVIVLEGSASVGGLLSTAEIGGTRLEHYYHHFFSHDAELAWLCGELGITDRLRYLPASMGMFRNGQHYPFNGPADLLRFDPISLASRARFAATSLYLGKVANWRKGEDTTAQEWFYRYAGRQATDAIWRPMLEIKFGSYASEVPIAWMIGRLSQRMNSRKKGDELLGYLDGSLDTLLRALMKSLSELGVTVLTKTPVLEFIKEGAQVRGVRTSQGEITTKKILATIPTCHLAPLVENADAKLAARLSSIKYFGAVCTLLEMDRPLSETYWLNVADPGFPFGGVIEHTNFIGAENYQGRHLAYLSRYFEWEDPLANDSHEVIKQKMITPLGRIFPRFNSKNLHQVHVFRTMTAATVCDRNFSRRVPTCKTTLGGLYIASMAHIYPDERSCNNSIRVAAEACRVMEIESNDVPSRASLAGQIGFSQSP